MKECCLLLLYATVVIAATLAHMGLFNFAHNFLLKARKLLVEEKYIKYRLVFFRDCGVFPAQDSGPVGMVILIKDEILEIPLSE